MEPAKRSPRLENNIIKWYEGDAFTLEWEIALTKDEAPLRYEPTDRLIFEFYTKLDKTLVHTFEFTNIEQNTVNLVFTKDISAKFPKGKYTYCVHFYHDEDESITIFAKNVVEVEACH